MLSFRVATHTLKLKLDSAGFDEVPPMNRWNGYYSSEYVSKNLTEADETWSKPVSGYGVVAVDRQWALAEGLPQSHSWVLDQSKNVYLLNAYHALHCAVRQ